MQAQSLAAFSAFDWQRKRKRFERKSLRATRPTRQSPKDDSVKSSFVQNLSLRITFDIARRMYAGGVASPGPAVLGFFVATGTRAFPEPQAVAASRQP